MQRIQHLQNTLVQNSLATPTSSKQTYPWVMKWAQLFNFEKVGDLKGKTVLITGASRGIGLAMAKKFAKDGANIVILAKTVTPHPKLPGTIHTAVKEIEEAGGKALGIQCDIRFENEVKAAVDQAVATFGGIDVLINNASAISLTGTEETDMKRYDLMHSINTRGTYMVSKYCVPHLKKSKNPHILNNSPPLSMEPRWFGPHVAYTMAKFGMSMCVLGMAEEFKEIGIAVNSIWPRTAIATAAVKHALGGEEMMRASRNEQIMADAAYVILTSNSKKTTGNFFIDDEVLSSVGVKDFDQYKIDPSVKDNELTPDFFI